MFDSNVLSLDEFAFACGVGPLSRRHIVEAFATVSWFNALAEHAEAQTVAAVARRYALPSQDSPEQRKMAHRQWAERSRGSRTPSGALIEYTDRQCEGSAKLFNHALWVALRVDTPFERHTDAMLQRLPPRFHRFVELKTLQKGNDHFRKMRNLSSSGSLEDLACLVFLMRMAIEEECNDLAYSLAKCIKKALLVQGAWLGQHGLLRPVIEYIDRYFFAKVGPPLDGIVSGDSYFSTLARLVDAFSARGYSEQGNFFVTRWSLEVREILAPW